MTALETLAVCFVLTVGVAGESQSASVRDDITTSPALNMQQLLAIAESLAQDMAAMKATRKSDQSRLTNLEKRTKKFDLDLMVRYEDIALLHNFMANINTTLRRVENSTSYLQMQVAHTSSTQQKVQEEVRKLEDRAQLLEQRLAELLRVAEARGSEASVADRGRNAMADFGLNPQDGQSRVTVLENAVSSRLDVHGEAEHEDKSTRGSRAGEPLRERGSGHVDVGHQLQLRSKADSLEFVEAGLSEDISGDGDDFIDIDSSGDEDKKALILDETQITEPTSRRNDVHWDGDIPSGTDTKVTSAHITLSPPSTEVSTAATDATQSDSPVRTLDSVSLLYQRLNDMEMRLNLTMPADEVMAAVIRETFRVNSELEKHAENLRQLESKMVELNTSVSWTASQTRGWKMMESMEGLQASLANFVNSVLTVEHWHAASVQLATASQRTDQRVSSLTSRVLDTTQLVHRLQTAVRDYQHLSERQFRVLQTHVIQLNNSVQDLLERIDKTTRINQGQLNDVYNTLNYGGEGQLLTSRLEDLALQLVYSDNRLSHLETTVLNASLARCQKENNDLHQDATLLRLNQAMVDVRNDVVVLRETIKRVDLSLYRLHGNGKVIQQDIRGLQDQVKKTEILPSVVQHLKQEVDNLLFQLPTDCDDCYERGFHKTGDYIIYPKNGLRAIKVRCIMDPWQEKDEEESNDLKEAAASKVKGGWTVIQQRHSGKVNFSRSWAEYEEGFGSSDTEYWIGNEVLHLMTSSGNYSLHIHMRDISGRYWHASYDVFAVSSKEDNYRLTLGRYRGNATDTLYYSSGMTFSTYDRDTDVSSLQCARYNGGGWWYRHCQISNLNGPFYAGMIWFHRDWHDWLQLSEVVMLIRCARCAK